MSNGITGKGRAWERKKTWWLTLLTAFFMGWISFLYMGIKTKQTKWKIEALIYCAILNITAVLNGMDAVKSNDILKNVIAWLMVGGWVVSIVRYVKARKEYLLRIVAMEQTQSDSDAELRTKIQSEYGIETNETLSSYTAQPVIPQPVPSTSQPVRTQSADNNAGNMPTVQEFASAYRQQQTNDSPSVVHPQASNPVSSDSRPTQTSSSQSVPNDVQQDKAIHAFDDSMVDINDCDADTLAKLPGISIPAARKAVAHRDETGGYESLDEFYTFLGLKPHIISQLSDAIVCGEPKGNGSKPRGRILDL